MTSTARQPESTIDPRVNGLRWTSHRGLDHLWLGRSTACGRDLRSLRPADAHPYCTTCLTYAQGWLDRDDFGPAPQPEQPNPTRRTGAPAAANVPEIVVLCGSTAFMAEFAEANLRETAAGRIVLSVGCNMKLPHPLWADPADAEALKVRLDGLHRAKIRLADRVLVVGRRAGKSTRDEIAYAWELGKPVGFVDAALAAEFGAEDGR